MADTWNIPKTEGIKNIPAPAVTHEVFYEGKLQPKGTRLVDLILQKSMEDET